MCYNIFVVSVRRLVWDPWNVAHIARHKVSPEEVDEACHGEYIVRQGHTGRLLIIGPTKSKRILAVVLACKTIHVYYVVTARPADRKERLIYQKEKGGVS